MLSARTILGILGSAFVLLLSACQNETFTPAQAWELLHQRHDSLDRLVGLVSSHPALSGVFFDGDTACVVVFGNDSSEGRYRLVMPNGIGIMSQGQMFDSLISYPETTVTELLDANGLDEERLMEMLVAIDSLGISGYGSASRNSGGYFSIGSTYLAGGTGLGFRHSDTSTVPIAGCDSVQMIDKYWFWYYMSD